MATVMVVDRDRGFVARLRRAGAAAGHVVVVATGVNEALQAMRQQAPDVVVSEVELDYVLAGWDLVRAMRADPALSSIPVVIVSALATGHTHGAKGPDATAEVSAWLAKPVSAAEVLERLAPLLAPVGAR